MADAASRHCSACSAFPVRGFLHRVGSAAWLLLGRCRRPSAPSQHSHCLKSSLANFLLTMSHSAIASGPVTAAVVAKSQMAAATMNRTSPEMLLAILPLTRRPSFPTRPLTAQASMSERGKSLRPSPSVPLSISALIAPPGYAASCPVLLHSAKPSAPAMRLLTSLHNASTDPPNRKMPLQSRNKTWSSSVLRLSSIASSNYYRTDG